LHRALHSLRSEMNSAVRTAEEVGYARGLEDAKKHPETLGLKKLVTDPSAAFGVIADALQGWLDYHPREHAGRGDLPADMHIYHPPVWPTRGVLKTWIAALRSSAPDASWISIADRLPTHIYSVLGWITEMNGMWIDEPFADVVIWNAARSRWQCGGYVDGED